MRKLSAFLAALLLATPAMAAVRIVVECTDSTAVVKYATDGEIVRAFALDITVSAGTIDGISNFIRGESTAEKPGYGIFPGNFARYISVDATTGEVASWDPNGYTPVADPCDPSALGGLGTNGVTIEMGALYYPTGDDSPNAPGTSGTLFTLTLSEPANVTVALNEARGGVVLTNPETAATVDLSMATNIAVGASAAAAELLSASHPDYAEWIAVGRPACWAYPRQCHGDADGRKENTSAGVSYVGQQDLNVLVAAWQVKEAPFGPGIAAIENGICADFAHDKEGSSTNGFYRVGVTDLNILVSNWLVKEAPQGAGVPANCGGNLVP